MSEDELNSEFHKLLDQYSVQKYKKLFEVEQELVNDTKKRIDALQSEIDAAKREIEDIRDFIRRGRGRG